jgi:hypothetical protein
MKALLPHARRILRAQNLASTEHVQHLRAETCQHRTCAASVLNRQATTCCCNQGDGTVRHMQAGEQHEIMLLYDSIVHNDWLRSQQHADRS